MKLKVLVTAIVLVSAGIPSAAEDVADWQVYIGTYTGGGSEGIYLLRLDGKTGLLEKEGLAAKVENPSFLALHPTLPCLYSVGDGAIAPDKRGGLVSAFRIDPAAGSLTLLNQQPTDGRGPCHVAVDRAGRHVLVANYNSGSVNVLPVTAEGTLEPVCDVEQHEGSSVNPKRQEGPHAHSVTLDGAGKFVFAADLGTDKMMIYRYDDASGKLEAHEPPCVAVAPGAGPRHFAFHPSGRFAYVVNELGNTVTAFTYEAEAGRLRAFQSVPTLPDGWEGENTTAEIRVHPSGRFVYASNRGHDSIAAFAVDEATGALTGLGQTLTQGRVPRNFNVSPDGRFLLAANQETNTVVAFRINTDSGTLEPAGGKADVATPVCVLFRAP